MYKVYSNFLNDSDETFYNFHVHGHTIVKKRGSNFSECRGIPTLAIKYTVKHSTREKVSIRVLWLRVMIVPCVL